MGYGSNLPPGVTEGMIPGNRPEDAEVELDIILTVGEINDIRFFVDNEKNARKVGAGTHWLFDTMESILEQIEEQYHENLG